MARKHVKEESDYQRKVKRALQIVWQFQLYYMDLLKAPRFPDQKRINNKGHLTLATEVLKGFSPGVFNSFCVTHNKNLQQPKFRTKELIIFLFSKVTLKATAINSDS